MLNDVIYRSLSICHRRSKSHYLPFLVFKGLGLPVLNFLILWRKFWNHLFVHVRAPWGLKRGSFISLTDSKLTQAFTVFLLMCVDSGTVHSPPYLTDALPGKSRFKISPHSSVEKITEQISLYLKATNTVRLKPAMSPCHSVFTSSLVVHESLTKASSLLELDFDQLTKYQHHHQAFK